MLIANERIIDRIKRMENTANAICNILVRFASGLSAGLGCFLLDFLFAIFNSYIWMVVKGIRDCFFELFEGHRLHHIRIGA